MQHFFDFLDVIGLPARPHVHRTRKEETLSVNVVTLKEQPVTLTRELAGRAIASVVAEIRPQADGIVQQLSFDEGVWCSKARRFIN
ncbi:hypothetical protein [Neopusillimonas aromaticivorans]|uniref:hypothetical protein n=1 Tax=Neopusillimonas aromaticivorans TaxID=2979868 RepID=UPI002594C88B|nr:hypothetical protein [Neopusillimonas aromaticivorans]WJJ94255.1 hypothetical protein N7E01_04180 [Neopusillimonas aromaticivorans]